jgi:hypothetical protein
MAMEIVQANVLFWHMYRQGAVHYAGGTEVRCPVVLEESANVGALSLYESFGTSPEDGPDLARFPTWYKNHCSVVFDETELGQNSGPEQVLDLLKVKLAISKQSLINDLNRQFFADGGAESATSTTPKELNGLRSLIDFDATPDLTVGGIPQAAAAGGYANWDNQYGAMTTFSTDGLRTWETVYMDASAKGSHPDLILVDPQVYRFFKELVAPNQTRADKAMWDQGFENLLFNGTPVVPEDELAGTGDCFFLTTTGRRAVNDFNLKPQYWQTPGRNPLVKSAATGRGIQLAILRKDDFRMTPFRYPPDADTLLAHCFFTSMFTVSSLARQGATDFGANAIAF